MVGDDLTDADPHLIRRDADETDGEFVRFESTMYPQDVAAAPDLPHEPWGLDNDFQHVHPNQTERWEVLSGELHVEVAGTERTLTEGEAVTLPAGMAHRHWNPTDEPIRVVWERRPAFDDEVWAESTFALAQTEATNADGVSGPLQTAVLIDAYPSATAYPAGLPVGLQRIVASALAPLGRALGVEATYTREDLTEDG